MSEASQLELKTAELDSLKKSYEEFIESSASLEKELEDALKEAEDRLAEANKKKQALEEKNGSLNDKVTNMNSFLVNAQRDIQQLKEKMDKVEANKVELERQIDELQERVRILEATEEDLTHKLQRAEEDLILKENDFDEFKLLQLDRERRLKSELTEVQAELARFEISASSDFDPAAADLNQKGDGTGDELDGKRRDSELEELELEIEDLTERLAQSEQQNLQLNEEVSRLADELIQIHEKNHERETTAARAADSSEASAGATQLSAEVSGLRQQLNDTQAAAAALSAARNSVQHDLQECREVIQRLEHQVWELEQELETKAAMYAALEAQMMEQSEAIRAAEARETVLKEELQALKQSVSQLDHDRTTALSLESDLRQRIAALEVSQDRLKSAEQEMERMRLEQKSQVEALSSSASTLSSADGDSPAIGVSTAESEREEQWLQEREGLVREIDFLQRALNKSIGASMSGHNTPAKAAVTRSERTSAGRSDRNSYSTTGSGSQSAHLNEDERAKDDASPWATAECVASIALLDTSELSRQTAEEALASGDAARVRELLLTRTAQLEAMRSSNARLLQKLQAARGNIQVCCRARPPTALEIAPGGSLSVEVVDDYELTCFDRRAESWRPFTFDRVWRMDCTQADVFADVEPLILSVIDGYNTCLFAYGQTGSGKTYTMNGYGEDYGVSYRSLKKIFEVLHTKRMESETQRLSQKLLQKASELRVSSPTGPHGPVANRMTQSDKLRQPSLESHTSADSQSFGHNGGGAEEMIDGFPAPGSSADEESKDLDSECFSYSVEVSMMEIYNDQVYDLLQGQGSEVVEIRQAADGSVHVPDLIKVPVQGLEDVLRVFAKGSANRATRSTHLNEHSSRSHSVLCIDVSSASSGTSTHAKLNLVDLAGSERVSKSGVTGAAMKETQHINKSLSALGDVMEALDQKAKHIPYRNSKLTYLLQDSLGGNSRTMMIVTVCPTEATMDETLFTLGFASRVRNVNLGVARKNVNVKNLEESAKAAHFEARELRKKRGVLEDTVTELRKQLKRSAEKMAQQADLRGKVVDDFRRTSEAQIQLLSKSNKDLTSRLQEEREAKQRLVVELEAAQKMAKKASEGMKELQKEKEKLFVILKQKEQEKEKETFKEVVPTLSKPAVRPSSSGPTQSSQMGPPQRGASAAPSMKPPRRVMANSSSDGLKGTIVEEGLDSDALSVASQSDEPSSAFNTARDDPNVSYVSASSDSPVRPVHTAPVASRPSVSSSVSGIARLTSKHLNMNSHTQLTRKSSDVSSTSGSMDGHTSGNVRRGSHTSVTSNSTTGTASSVLAPTAASMSRTYRAKAAHSFSADHHHAASSAQPRFSTSTANRSASTAVVPPSSSSTGSTTNSSSTSSSAAPSSSASLIRSGIATRSKEALLRHQERMEKFRERQAKLLSPNTSADGMNPEVLKI